MQFQAPGFDAAVIKGTEFRGHIVLALAALGAIWACLRVPVRPSGSSPEIKMWQRQEQARMKERS